MCMCVNRMSQSSGVTPKSMDPPSVPEKRSSSESVPWVLGFCVLILGIAYLHAHPNQSVLTLSIPGVTSSSTPLSMSIPIPPIPSDANVTALMQKTLKDLDEKIQKDFDEQLQREVSKQVKPLLIRVSELDQQLAHERHRLDETLKLLIKASIILGCFVVVYTLILERRFADGNSAHRTTTTPAVRDSGPQPGAPTSR